MKVLIVEDNPAVQRSVTRIMETRGHQVVAAENGLEAFALLGDDDDQWGAIVCDLALPFLQGNRFYDQLKASHPALAQRVVFVTGFATDSTTETFLRSTGQPFMAKPFEATELLEAVERVSREPEAP